MPPFPRILLFGLALCIAREARALDFGGGNDITAVSGKTSPDYVRLRLASGAFPVELYSFGEGGHFGGPMHDASIDPLKFMDVARVIAPPLADQNYLPGKDPATVKLLIMVYWGLTDVPPPIEDSVAHSQFSAAQVNLSTALSAAASASGKDKAALEHVVDAAMAQMSGATVMLNMVNRQNDRADFANAKMLGYDSEGVIGTEYGSYVKGTPLEVRRDDMVAEIEENRYFVVLMAYDFQILWKQKKHKLLWETRFSIRQRHHNFDKDLPSMAQYASQYFGQDSHGLIHKEIPQGRVDIGDVKSLGSVPDK
ncbi:MAG TPA: hypothetical protein VII09_05750 [Opitutaceae bacterium]